MNLEKIIIQNFKSIEKIEFDIKKYGNSYTIMLLGINEVGKSNILQAMSYLNAPTEDFDYHSMHNQKDESNEYIDLWFHLSFEHNETYLKELKTKIKNSEALKFDLIDISKNVYLGQDEKKFTSVYNFGVKNLTSNLFIKRDEDTLDLIIDKIKVDDTYVELTEKIFKEFFIDIIGQIIKKYEPKVSFWRPSDRYLISSVDLNEFKDNININTPLKNIFILSGYSDQQQIKEKINEISDISLRRKLMSSLSGKTTNYVKSIWKHDIAIDIEITESAICNVSIKDNGQNNEHNFYTMNARSEGFKQFMSLILSLSIETKKLNKNKLILIDEPETHLHPSGIRDLGKELLAIGEKNYLFVATHSPFLIDKEHKERNIIIKKDNSAFTIKKEIRIETDMRDDEVLTEAFGINVYKDLLNPHKILIEGASDKLILEKSLHLKGFQYGLTNGIGSNIVHIASRLNHDEIKVLVITDDDSDGKKYRDEIIRIGGVFSSNNVFTVRDLVGIVKNGATIEDLLGEDFITSKFKEFYKLKFNEDIVFNFNETSPYIDQVKIFLQQNNKFTKETIDEFKKKLSDDFKPTKKSFDEKFPFLKELVEKIKEKI